MIQVPGPATHLLTARIGDSITVVIRWTARTTIPWSYGFVMQMFSEFDFRSLGVWSQRIDNVPPGAQVTNWPITVPAAAEGQNAGIQVSLNAIDADGKATVLDTLDHRNALRVEAELLPPPLPTAIGIGVLVDWIATEGDFPGQVIDGPFPSGSFPGECRWRVRLATGQVFELEGRDLRITGGTLEGPTCSELQPPPPSPTPIEITVEVGQFIAWTDQGQRQTLTVAPEGHGRVITGDVRTPVVISGGTIPRILIMREGGFRLFVD